MEHLTKEEVEELRRTLLRMKEEILKRARENLKTSSSFEGGDEIDRANYQRENFLNLRLLSREAQLLKRIDYMLLKMEEGTYGVCENCGEPIPYKRLKARPVARLCIRCKEEEELNEGQ